MLPSNNSNLKLSVLVLRSLVMVRDRDGLIKLEKFWDVIGRGIPKGTTLDKSSSVRMTQVRTNEASCHLLKTQIGRTGHPIYIQ